MATLSVRGWREGRKYGGAESLLRRRTWMPQRHNHLWYPVYAGKHEDQSLFIGGVPPVIAQRQRCSMDVIYTH